jgi:hypothetical protein
MQEAAIKKWKILSGILAISINGVILTAAFYNYALEIYEHPLVFVMIGFGIITLIYSGGRKRTDKTDKQG